MALWVYGFCEWENSLKAGKKCFNHARHSAELEFNRQLAIDTKYEGSALPVFCHRHPLWVNEIVSASLYTRALANAFIHYNSHGMKRDNNFQLYHYYFFKYRVMIGAEGSTQLAEYWSCMQEALDLTSSLACKTQTVFRMANSKHALSFQLTMSTYIHPLREFVSDTGQLGKINRWE